jgi:hypothetical protein
LDEGVRKQIEKEQRDAILAEMYKANVRRKLEEEYHFEQPGIKEANRHRQSEEENEEEKQDGKKQRLTRRDKEPNKKEKKSKKNREVNEEPPEHCKTCARHVTQDKSKPHQLREYCTICRYEHFRPATIEEINANKVLVF